MSLNDSNASQIACDNQNNLKGGIIALIIIPASVVIVNIVVTVAVINYRSRLRQKNVYIYVTSLLMANIVFGLLAVYQMIAVPLNWEGNPLSADASPALKGWWSFRKSLSTSLFLVMIGNIGILIVAIRDGANIIAKSSSRQMNGNRSNSIANSLSFQRNKALVLVSVVWTLPIILSLATIGEWNCTMICSCTASCFRHDQQAFNKPLGYCSRLWTPMTNSYMGVVVIFWALEIIMLFTLIIRTLQTALKQKRFRLQVTTRLSSAEANHDTNVNSVSKVPRPEAGDDSQYHSARESRPGSVTSNAEMSASQAQNSIAPPTDSVANREENGLSGSSGGHRYAFYTWSRSATKELFILVLVFVACTLPTMVVIIFDIFAKTPIPSTISFTMLSLALIYCVVCPFLLMRHLGGLKAAMELLCVKATGTRRVSKKASSQT